MSRKLFLVRHGETMWNRERRLQGHQDAPLTRIGVEQALRVGRTLRGYVGDPGDCQVLVSPLGRCRQTAALICEELDFDYRHCRFDDAIKEIGWGVWDGLTRDEFVDIGDIGQQVQAIATKVNELAPEEAVEIKPQLTGLLEEFKSFAEEVRAKLAALAAANGAPLATDENSDNGSA